jgi:hypothetical protein
MISSLLLLVLLFYNPIDAFIIIDIITIIIIFVLIMIISTIANETIRKGDRHIKTEKGGNCSVI